jgi:hypothetical protein
LRDLKRNHKDIKVRVEEPHIQIYASSESVLQDIVTNKFAGFPARYIESISGPANDQTRDILNTGAIIRKTDLGYKYKILMRDGLYDKQTKEALLNYITNIGVENATMPKGCIKMLTKDTRYIWNLYLYVNDLSVITFLNLIHPSLVLNYHELIVVADK